MDKVYSMLCNDLSNDKTYNWAFQKKKDNLVFFRYMVKF